MKEKEIEIEKNNDHKKIGLKFKDDLTKKGEKRQIKWKDVEKRVRTLKVLLLDTCNIRVLRK